LQEVKKVYQYIKFRPVNLATGAIDILNQYAFTNLSDFEFSWEVTADGEVVSSGNLPGLSAAPGEVVKVKIPFSIDPEPGTEYFLSIRARQRKARGLVDAGYEVAAEQFLLPVYIRPETVDKKNFEELSVEQDDETVTLQGDRFIVVFDKKAGILKSMKKGETEFLVSGPVPDLWRAPTDNDFGNGLDRRSRIWRKAGEDRIMKQFTVTRVSPKSVYVKMIFDLPGENNQPVAAWESAYTVFGSGDIIVDNHFRMLRNDLPEIVRMGMNLVMPRSFDRISWLGRGPHESYIDRKTSAFVGLYHLKVADMYFPYVRPQENGNRTDVRWAAITDSTGCGLLFKGMPLLEVTAHHNVMEDFESPVRTVGRIQFGQKVINRHVCDVKPRNLTSVNVDFRQMGVGGDDSWGALTHEQYRLTARNYSYSYLIHPLNAGDNPVQAGKLFLH